MQHNADSAAELLRSKILFFYIFYMSNPALKKRLEEVLRRKGFFRDDSLLQEVDRDSIDDICDDLGINVLEKAYVVGLDPRLIFSDGFLKGISFLELNRKADNFSLWKCILRI